MADLELISKKIQELLDLGIKVDIDMATEGIATEATLAKLTSLSGTGTDTTLTLTNANTAYQVPASPPTSDYSLIISNVSDSKVYFRFTEGTTGGAEMATGVNLTIDFAANQKGYLYCASAGKVVNVSYKIM